MANGARVGLSRVIRVIRIDERRLRGYYNPILNDKGQEVDSRSLIKELERDGWALVRVTGSHHHFRHPTKPGTVTVPHPKKDLKKGLEKAIRKSAGLK